MTKYIVELSEEEIKILEARQISRMQLIKAGMGVREPIDFIIQKIVNTFLLPSGDYQELYGE